MPSYTCGELCHVSMSLTAPWDESHSPSPLILDGPFLSALVDWAGARGTEAGD